MAGDVDGNSRRRPSMGWGQGAGRLEPARDADDGQPWAFIDIDVGRHVGAVMRSTSGVDAIVRDQSN